LESGFIGDEGLVYITRGIFESIQIGKMKEHNLLASVALFGELYNNPEYKSVSDIIAEFIKGAVVYENKLSFNSTELKNLLEKVYEFKIPESVIRTTLNNKMKDVVERKFGYYHFDEKIKKEHLNISAEFDLINSNHNQILVQLQTFIEGKEKKHLSENDKKEVFENFNHFLLDNGLSDKYSNHISTFIIVNEEKPGFTDSLNAIKEGVILYQGIKYTADINELGKWNTDLTIYLNTEELFSALGYNGLLFQEIFMDFYKLVTEINASNKSQKQRKKIELKYFEETKAEVDNFFFVAESVKNGTKQFDPSKSAMKKIMDTTSTLSDIRALRVKFDLDLKLKGILLQDFDHGFSNLIKYNVEDQNVLEELRMRSVEKNRHFDENICLQYFRIFTKINFFRKGENNKPFEKIGHLFITENGFAKYLAHNNAVKFGENDVSFAKDIDYITTKFWFKLKKGFSDKQNLPKSFDVITKAKIILSSHLNALVSHGYQKLLEETKSKRLSKEEALERSYEYRERPIRPEEINIENVDKSFDFLNNETYFEDLYREKQRKETLLKETEEKNVQLQNEIERRDEIEKQKEIDIEQKKYDKRKDAFIIGNLKIIKRKKWRDLVFLVLVFILNLTLAVLAIVVTATAKIKDWISEWGAPQIIVVLLYALLIVVEIIGSKYFFNKEKLKNGLAWLTIVMGRDEKLKEFESQSKKELDTDFKNQNK
jgi:hypothetical protein